MRALISLWFTELLAAFRIWKSSLFDRLLGRLPNAADVLLGPSAPPQPRGGGPRRQAELPGAAGIWVVAPRLTLAIWVAGGLVAIAHHFHLFRGLGAGRPPASGRQAAGRAPLTAAPAGTRRLGRSGGRW